MGPKKRTTPQGKPSLRSNKGMNVIAKGSAMNTNDVGRSKSVAEEGAQVAVAPEKSPEVAVVANVNVEEAETIKPMGNDSNIEKVTEGSLLVDRGGEPEIEMSLKDKLMKATTKVFTIDADVHVNNRTNRFTEPGSGKQGSNVRCILNRSW